MAKGRLRVFIESPRMKRLFILTAALLTACASHDAIVPEAVPQHASDTRTSVPPQISHIVIIMLENRSFDTFFGKFPGANGIPQNPTCSPDPITGNCVYPYHDTALNNYGGPHSPSDVINDIDGGKLDGFVESAYKYHTFDPNIDEVMGYHTQAELPYYWSLASKYTLADNNFAASTSWSTMQHLYLVSGWSAQCSIKGDPMSCVSSNDINLETNPDFAWTDITWLLHAHGISWSYYFSSTSLFGPSNDEGDGEAPRPDNVIRMWNPLPAFDDVRIDGEEANIKADKQFRADATAGTLAAVSWVVPPFISSDHPSASIADSQKWVKGEIDSVMDGPDWQSTIILVTWDEFGGFYDHVIPPVIDGQGYGFRTPLIIVGPMVKKGYIDHQLLSTDAYLKLIEDTFLGGERIDNHDGRRDSRPDVRENTPGLGDLRNDLTGSR